ncbi:MAG TPA: hypothetical protein VKA15_24110 [Isosphaeraceae bacterium]|nr:hypothetical protein [Isosphaeraceae bacterium]
MEPSDIVTRELRAFFNSASGAADMTEEQLIGLIDPVLRDLGSLALEGEEFRQPPLDVVRYYERSVRLSFVPLLGRARSVVTLVRQPVDIAGTVAGYERLLKRLGMAVNGRFPPWRGLVIGLTAITMTPEPIQPADDAMLRDVLGITLRRMRVVPFGLLRINLGQEAIALAIKSSPDELFAEPLRLADLLTQNFRRYVPAIEF